MPWTSIADDFSKVESNTVLEFEYGYKKLNIGTPGKALSIERLDGVPELNSRCILLIGLTGAGKSTFIESFASDKSLGISKDQLEGATADIISYRLINATKNDCPVYLVDTPGFLDRKISEMKVLNMIKDWTNENNLMFDRILYFDRITDTRMARTRKKSLELFKSMTGKDTANYIVFVTSMWDQICNENQEDRAQMRLQELREIYYKDFLDRGAQIVEFRNTQESSLNILDLCVTQWRDKLFEYENTRRPVCETQYGHSLYRNLYDRVEGLRKQHRSIQSDLRHQSITQDEGLISVLLAQQEEVEADLQKFEEELIDFGVPPSTRLDHDTNPAHLDRHLLGPETSSHTKQRHLRNKLNYGTDQVLNRTVTFLKAGTRLKGFSITSS